MSFELVQATTTSPIGELLLVATPAGIARLAFESEDWGPVVADVHRTFEAEQDQTTTSSDMTDGAEGTAGSDTPGEAHLELAMNELESYFDGDLRRFSTPVDLSPIHGFRRTVLDNLQTIPYGETASYGEVAAASGSPRAARAVGSSCSHNPVPIFIPCHRVTTSDRRIGGYLGGTSTKEFLLRLEGAAVRYE